MTTKTQDARSNGARQVARTVLRSLAAALACCVTPVHSQPVDNETVRFETREPGGATVPLRGVLWHPTTTSKGVVVLVHGSGGLRTHPVGHYARAFSAAGYTALAIDAFGPRGIDGTVDDQSRLSSLQMARDAFAALRFLVERGHDGERAAIIGFSKGGTAVLQAADRNFLPGQTLRFRAVLAFYPGCALQPRVPRPAGALYMALGAEDDYVGNGPCEELVRSIREAGGNATLKVYPGAAHAFDGDPDLTRLTRLRRAENFSACRVFLEPDGRLEYRGTHYAAGDRALMADMRAQLHDARRHGVDEPGPEGRGHARRDRLPRPHAGALSGARPPPDQPRQDQPPR